ncbi:SSUH2 protein, partial [Polyodon spathula]|nr:SSUH2 protein [Polyodon spathula]
MPVLYFPVTKGLLMEACTQDHRYRQQLDTQNPPYDGPTAPPCENVQHSAGIRRHITRRKCIPSISEDTARDALVQYASSKCCYSTKPAETLVFSNLESHNTYRYRLETFTESRSTEWAHELYRGQPVDAYTQPPPAPWAIPAKAPTMFKDATQEIKIPNTAYVKPCHTCTGMGMIPCTKCARCGSKQCWVCNGSRVRAGGESCHHCNGSGRTTCDGCNGTGLNSCNTCKGKGQLLVYIRLKIKWKNNVDDFVVDQESGFPINRVSAVTGKKVFVDKQHMVSPAVGSPDPDISKAAKRLVRQHHAKFASTYRILQQVCLHLTCLRVQEHQRPLVRIPSISEDFAKDAFIEYASSKCCYSSRPAKELVFTDLQAHDTYRYRLETFVESRTTEWASVPYTGQVVDSYGSCVPAPWDIAVQVPAMFQNGKRTIQVPHTSSVKGCHNCLALGKSACQKCIASGWMQCWVCNGSGSRMSNNRCSHCNGVGRVRCTECSGRGSKTCHTCTGKGQLLFFINLIVEWKNHIFEFVPDKRSGFPVDQISKVTGELLFTDTQYLVYPVVSFPDNAINQASQRAVREHQAQFVTTSRILQQRQSIELIPVTRVHYTWKEKTYIYFVYGAEHKVYTDDYPAKCCCCTII